MKKILVFALVCIMAIACSPVEEGQEILQAEPQAQQAPSLDPDKTYYAHFKVELQNNSKVVLNSIELDESYWQTDEQDRLMPDMVRIQEELGFEALETLRGDSVKLSSVFIAAEEKLDTGEMRDASYCSSNFVPLPYGLRLPFCDCFDELVITIVYSISHPNNLVTDLGNGYMLYCFHHGVSVAWVPNYYI